MAENNNGIFAVEIGAALGAGLVGGVFFAFSTFVMSALSRLSAAQGIAAMQSINITVLNPLFMTTLFGTAALCIYLAISSLTNRQQAGSGALLLGSLLYLGGTILVTIIGNVPLNDALATVEPSSPHGATLWTRYLDTWTMWNHVRTIASLAASAALMIALRAR